MVTKGLADSEPIRVAIVEDDVLLRDGLVRMIDGAEGLCCAVAVSSAEEGLERLRKHAADVLLLDIGLPRMNGCDAVSVFREMFPSLTVLMLTVFSDRDLIFASICKGASGYLLKSTPPRQLFDAIRAAHAGGSPLSPEIAREIVDLFQKVDPPRPPAQALTRQELQLLRLLALGHSYDSSARQMNVSVNTVRNYIRSVYEKLHVHSKSAAVSAALRQGLIG